VIQDQVGRCFVYSAATLCLYQTAQPKVLLNNNVCRKSAYVACVLDWGIEYHTVYCGHDESDLHGIGGAGEMGVNLLGLVLVERDEAVEDVVTCRSVVWATLVVGKIVLHRADGELLLESVDLVQEQDDRGLDEPPRVADGVEKCESFLHAVDRLVLKEQLVVLGDGDQEKDGGDILEAVYPLFSFRSLATDVEHAVCEVADDEGGLGDTSRLDTRPEHVLVVGDVVGRSDAVD
jgi:hypothetical protein